MQDISIDKEFKDMIPPLSPNEFELLESSLLSEGCRDSVVLWDGVIIDGHNRYEICTKHNLEFKTVNRAFPDRISAENWIDENQLGRRNATPDQLSLIRGRLYNRLKKQGERTDLTLGQNDTKLNTAEILAGKHGVSPSTIKRDGAAQAIIHQHPEEEKAVIAGEKKKSAVLKSITPPATMLDTAPQPEMVTIEKEQYEEMKEMLDASLEEEKALADMLDAEPDDRLTAATAQIKQLVEQVRLLKMSLDGANNRNNEYLSMIKIRDRKIAKLAKELDAYKIDEVGL